MRKANVAKSIIFLLAGCLVLVYSYAVLKVPVFADGTQHVWLTDHVREFGTLPSEDITGIQPSNFSVPISINNSQPFVYQPLFYVLSGSLGLVIGNSEYAINAINIISVLLTALFGYLILRKLFNQRSALIGLVIIVCSNIWPWLIVHRIVEPILIALATAIMFLISKNKKLDTKSALVVVILLVFMYGVKASVLPIIFTVLVYITFQYFRNMPKLLMMMTALIILICPILFWSLKSLNSLTPSPVGIEMFDNFFKDAWWNQELQSWELSLNDSVNEKELREMTQEQFKTVQITPSELLNVAGPLGLLNEFSILPLSARTNEGYQSTIAKQLAPIGALLAILSIAALLARRKMIIQNWPIFSFYIGLLTVTFIFWGKQPVFRYYMYILIISALLYAVALDFLIEKSSRKITVPILAALIAVGLSGVSSEVARDIKYQHTAIHRAIPNDKGGLKDSITFAEKVRDENDQSEFIFTPMTEIAYYSRKRLLWDNRLFFVNDEIKLEEYLKHYNYKFVVLPFFSGQQTKANWAYYDGVPSDSKFYELLSDPNKYRVIQQNDTFIAYQRIGQ